MAAKPTMPALRDFRPFLGYGPQDYVAAKAFYQDIGFKLLWDSDNACEFDTGSGQRFLVTLHHGLERSNAGMLSLWVSSVDEWKVYLKSLQLEKKYPGVKIADPTITEWGWRILYVWDPCLFEMCHIMDVEQETLGSLVCLRCAILWMWSRRPLDP